MKTAGVIVEYNPFHHGHLYHLNETRKKTSADIVIAVMSGYFLQRGEPALLPRRLRTLTALRAGADLVVELPFAFSSQHATWFARGAISILDALGTDTVVFGSEQGDIHPFLKADHLLYKYEDEWTKHLRLLMKEGYSYPKASSLAFEHLTFSNHTLDLSSPNNILGFQYVKAIRELQASINADTIPRTGAGYHEKSLHKFEIASATSIRRTLLQRQSTIEDIRLKVPDTTYEVMSNYVEQNGLWYNWEHYYPFLQYILNNTEASSLAEIYEANEGLHQRFIQMSRTSSSFQMFMEAVKTKRYTWTRLQRFAVHLLCGTQKSVMDEALKTKKADHIRLLGMNDRGREYLKKHKTSISLPITSRMTRDKTAQWNLDEKAALAYYLPLPPKKRIKKWKEEYAAPPLIVSTNGDDEGKNE